MTITLQNILEAQEIMQNLSTKVLRGRTAYQVARLLKRLDAELSTYNDTRLKLIEQYAKKKEDGSYELNDRNEYQFTEENMQAYVGEINNLLQEKIEIDANPLKLDDLLDLDFTPREMVALEPFVEE